MVRAPDEVGKEYVHKLHRHFTYEPKLSPCVIYLWWGAVFVCLFVYMIWIFITRLLKSLKTEHRRGWGGREFLDDGCLTEGYSKQWGTCEERHSSCQAQNFRSVDEVSSEIPPAWHLLTMPKPTGKGGTCHGKFLLHLPHQARWSCILWMLLKAPSWVPRDSSFTHCLPLVPNYRHKYWLHSICIAPN